MDFLTSGAAKTAPPWKVLLVDDEPEVHEVTRLVLRGFRFEDRPLQLLSADGFDSAVAVLESHPDVAVALIDVVMETEDAGLRLVRHIREVRDDHRIRLILRTGQPGQAPEQDVIRDYDINDYKEKTELTAQKLTTTLYAALRGHRDLMVIEASRAGLERVLAASSFIFSHEQTTEFASAVLSQLTALVGMERGALYFKLVATDQANDDVLRVAAATGDFSKLVDSPASQGLPPRLLDTLHAAVERKEHQFRDDHYVLHFTDSHQTESLLFVGEAWDLSDLDYQLVKVFCTNVSIGFENIHLQRELIDAQMEMICVLAGAAETRSQETAAHVRRVGLLAGLLARRLGMSETEAESLRHAAPLHDIGKIGIPDAVLNKPGKHTDEEMLIMRRHAEIGHQMLSQSKRGVFRLAAEVAITHHENWDGSGYPNGLKGESIPISGRITAIADVCDALGSKRCYKDAWPESAVQDFLRTQSGIKFDPTLVDLLLTHWEEAMRIRAEHPD